MGCPIFIVHNEIADNELSSPFTYLRRVVESNGSSVMMSKSSTCVRFGAFEKRVPFERRSSPVNSVSPPTKEFETPLVVQSINDIETFLVG